MVWHHRPRHVPRPRPPLPTPPHRSPRRPLADAAPLYRERSPVHNAAQITQPVLVIYGLDDDIVPPEQAEAIIQALRQRGVPVTQLAFPDEGHGLRRPDSVNRAIEAELTFYRTLLASSQ
ncbi:MAG: alpha/beta hydrolase family protein [Pseudonocardiaceae bacterium]